MTAIGRAASTIVGELNRLGADYALIGGFAVSARTEPRFTQDLEEEIGLAAEAVRLIRQRGYNRGRDLQAELEGFLDEPG